MNRTTFVKPGLSQEDETMHETSGASVFSDEGLDLSQKLSESIFAGPDLDPDGEEIILGKGHIVLPVELRGNVLLPTCSKGVSGYRDLRLY